MELVQGKESAGKSGASSDRKRCQKISGKLYDWERRRRAAHWSEREETHSTEAGKEPTPESFTKHLSTKNALIGFTTNAYSFKRLALLRLHLPIPPLSPDLNVRHTRTSHLTPQHWLLRHLG